MKTSIQLVLKISKLSTVCLETLKINFEYMVSQAIFKYLKRISVITTFSTYYICIYNHIPYIY